MPLCRLWRAVWCPTLGNSAHVLIPGTPKYVSLHSKMDFTDLIIGHTWRWENHPDYLNEFHLVTWVPEGRRGQEGCESERWELEKCPEVRVVCKDLRAASRKYGWLPADSQQGNGTFILQPPGTVMPPPEWARERLFPRASRMELNWLTLGL